MEKVVPWFELVNAVKPAVKPVGFWKWLFGGGFVPPAAVLEKFVGF